MNYQKAKGQYDKAVRFIEAQDYEYGRDLLVDLLKKRVTFIKILNNFAQILKFLKGVSNLRLYHELILATSNYPILLL